MFRALAIFLIFAAVSSAQPLVANLGASSGSGGTPTPGTSIGNTSVGNAGTVNACYLPGIGSGATGCNPGASGFNLAAGNVIFLTVGSNGTGAFTVTECPGGSSGCGSGPNTINCGTPQESWNGATSSYMHCTMLVGTAESNDYFKLAVATTNADVWMLGTPYTGHSFTAVDIAPIYNTTAVASMTLASTFGPTNHPVEVIYTCGMVEGTRTVAAGTNFTSRASITSSSGSLYCFDWITTSTEMITSGTALMTASLSGNNVLGAVSVY
jgi:hypothetical protein